MTNEELEQKLQEAANEIEPRDFDEIWREIEPIVTKPKKEKKKFPWKKWTPLFATMGCVAIVCAVAIPVALSQGDNTGNSGSSQSSEIDGSDSDISLPAEEVYLEDELFTSIVTEAEFYQYLGQTDMILVDITDYLGTSYAICKIVSGEVKGGVLELVNDTSMMRLKFYHKNVDVSEMEGITYESNYTTTNGATVAYKTEEQGTAVKYYVKAEYKDLQYYIEYTTVADEGTAFFEELFQ